MSNAKTFSQALKVEKEKRGAHRALSRFVETGEGLKIIRAPKKSTDKAEKSDDADV